MAIPTLAVEEYQFGDAGMLLNGDPPVPFFDVQTVEGLDSAPVRLQQVDREGTDGGYVDSEFESSRTLTLTGVIYAAVTNMETYLDALKANFAPSKTSQPFYFQTDAGLRVIYGKSQGLKYPKDQLRRIGSANAQVQIVCEDSRIYSPTAMSQSVNLAAGVVAGRGYPKSYPFGYGAPVTQGGLVIVLSGNRDTPAILRIDGSITNPVVVNDTLGITMAFNLILNSGDFLTIDLDSKAVLLNNVTSVRNALTLTGGWFKLLPGSTSFRLQGTQSPSTPIGKLTVSAFPAFR